jgi:hypothetical protein
VIESDRVYHLEDLPLGTDLQVEVSPFVKAVRSNNTSQVTQQAEIFIGHKKWYSKWTEVGDTVERTSLSVLNASNHLFADYQPHNSNVFSIVDDFCYHDDNGTHKLSGANASYYVLGWHYHAINDPFYMREGDLAVELGDRLGTLMMQIQNDKDDAVKDWSKTSKPARTLCHGAIYNVEWNLQDAPPSPAHDVGCHLKNSKPIAVGSTPTDT